MNQPEEKPTEHTGQIPQSVEQEKYTRYSKDYTWRNSSIFPARSGPSLPPDANLSSIGPVLIFGIVAALFIASMVFVIWVVSSSF